MAAPPPPPRARGGLSLYDDLHDPNDPAPPATISAAPVLYGQADSAPAESNKPVDPALRFQPQIRRPPVKQAKTKGTFPKGLPKTVSAPAVAPAPPKTTLADWTATEEDEWMYGMGQKPQRGGRKKKKKKQQVEPEDTNWDEFYDPSKPTNVEQYLKSQERINEVLDWKAALYRHRRRRSYSDMSSDDEDNARSLPQNHFAPPPAHAFGPPPPSPPKLPPNNQSGDEVIGRRMPIDPEQPSSSLSAPASTSRSPLPPIPSNSAVISRAPVMYTQAHVGAEGGEEEACSPLPTLGSGGDDAVQEKRSRLPGQAGFAHRLMSKYGWNEGTGLGANESGIVNPLRVQVEKRRKKADAVGGGWAEPGSKGKILGGKRREEESKFGKMSEVIVLRNMLESMQDLQAEISEGLGQEIGEECGEKYGRVERLYIDQDARQVFIKFTDQVSALRAVNELDGRIFNGNAIVPKFYDAEKFERGIYTLS